MTATSKKGRGSVFSLVIPAGVNVAEQPTLDRNNTADHRDGKKEKSEPPKLSGRVLVAEDVKTNQMLCKWTLKKPPLVRRTQKTQQGPHKDCFFLKTVVSRRILPSFRKKLPPDVYFHLESPWAAEKRGWTKRASVPVNKSPRTVVACRR